MLKLYLLISAAACALYGSTHAASTSHKEVVSFINEDKRFVCKGEDAKWFLPNGTRITHSSDKYQIDNSSNEESILTVKQINSFKIGTYRCLISSDVEEKFELKLYFPLTINHLHRIQIVKENDNVVLKCKTISVPKVAKVTWYFEERELVPDVDFKPLHDGILLENVKAENTGKYTCVAVQELESLKNIQERHQQLLVEYAPRQEESEPKEIMSKIGETVTLRCDAKSEPKPSFSWLAAGYETFSNIEMRDYSSSLKVEINEESDFTTYTCLAVNEYGRVNQTFVLRERSPQEEEEKKSGLSKASKAAGATLFAAVALIISTFL